MTSHLRQNRRSRICVLACAILSLLWIISAFYTLGYIAPSGAGLAISNGAIYGGVIEQSADKPGWFCVANAEHVPYLAPSAFAISMTAWLVFVPMWIPLAIAATPAVVTFSKARRQLRLGLCHQCGYSRAGLAAESRCPECGDV